MTEAMNWRAAPQRALVVMGSADLDGSPFEASLRAMLAVTADNTDTAVLVDDPGPNRWLSEMFPPDTQKRIVRWSLNDALLVQIGWEKLSQRYFDEEGLERLKKNGSHRRLLRNEARDRCVIDAWLPSGCIVSVVALHRRGSVCAEDFASLKSYERIASRSPGKVIIQRMELVW